MDINSQIIEAVKGCPLLYNSNASIAERQREWDILAEQMNLKERFIKSRWHILREYYRNAIKNSPRNNVNFKYHNEMKFIFPQLVAAIKAASEAEERERKLPQHLMRPAFIITKEDIEDDSDDEEYVFLEIDTLEVSGAEEEEPVPPAVQQQQIESPNDEVEVQELTQRQIQQEDEAAVAAAEAEMLKQVQERLELEHDTEHETEHEVQHEVIVDVTETESEMTGQQQQRQQQQQQQLVHNIPQLVAPAVDQPQHRDDIGIKTAQECEAEAEQFEPLTKGAAAAVTGTKRARKSNEEKAPTRATKRPREISMLMEEVEAPEQFEFLSPKRELANEEMRSSPASASARAAPLPDTQPASEQFVDCKTSPSTLERNQERSEHKTQPTGPEGALKSTKNPVPETEAERNPTETKQCNGGEKERGEDVIFGELVAAMLQRMPDERKRGIKREIMNLLLA